ncbi:MAG: C40 family peptidase [Fibrobacterota bacterium]
MRAALVLGGFLCCFLTACLSGTGGGSYRQSLETRDYSDIEDTSRISPRYRRSDRNETPSKSSQSSQKKSSSKATEKNSPRNERAFLKTAKSYLGVPYRLGGTTRRGMDCSGYIYRVHSDLNYSGVSRTTSANLYRKGEAVPRWALEVGDLCFFGSRGRVTHVGFYIGNNKFIHASSSRGVMISSLNNSYWKTRIVGFRRYP